MNPQLVRKIIPGPMTESLVGSTVEDEEMVCKMIHETMPQLEVIEMQTVKNSFLEAMFLLKKEEYKSRYGRAPQEKLLFHVTAASNVNSIISNNFDWRRISRGKFGLGTSFSGDARYANRYANYNIGDKRAIIITKVLVSKTTGGHYGMKIPRKKYDTATGNGDKVYVKFSDNEILPKYVVFYSSDFTQTNKNIKKNSSQKKQHTDSKPQSANTSRKVLNNYDYYDYDDGEFGSDDHEDEYDEGDEGDYEEEYVENCEEEEFYEEEECEEEEFCEEEECEEEEFCEEEEYEEEEFCEEEEFEDEDEDEYDEDCEEEEECEEEEDEYDYEDEECEEESDEYYEDEEEYEDEYECDEEGYAVECYDDKNGVIFDEDYHGYY